MWMKCKQHSCQWNEWENKRRLPTVIITLAHHEVLGGTAVKYVYACKKDTITNFERERKTKKTIEERGAFERKEETEWKTTRLRGKYDLMTVAFLITLSLPLLPPLTLFSLSLFFTTLYTLPHFLTFPLSLFFCLSLPPSLASLLSLSLFLLESNILCLCLFLSLSLSLSFPPLEMFSICEEVL